MYIHVPFCDEICKFCPFHKQVTNDELVQHFVNGVLLEIAAYGRRRDFKPLEFIYFGGGTPSVLSPGDVGRILEQLILQFGLQPNAEICLEVHPHHADKDRLGGYRSHGANRFSFGIQSFQSDKLKRLGATHTEAQSYQAVESALSVVDNVAIDLLYRYSGQSRKDWEFELSTAIDKLGIPHLSCYSLVEVGRGDPNSPGPEQDVELAVQAMEFCDGKGFQHYASCASGGFDTCRPGLEGRYELQHWQAPQASFLALGPGAIGFVGDNVTVNVLNLKKYCERLKSGHLPLLSATHANDEELKRRYFALGVKTLRVPLGPYRSRFGTDPNADLGPELAWLINNKLAVCSDDDLTLTHIGRLFVDTCSACFYSDSERNVPHPEEPDFRALERRPELAA